MLKVNDWYFVPKQSNPTLPENALGVLNKVTGLTDNPNYVNTEQWIVTNDKKYLHRGTYSETDSVYLTKHGKKVKPPSKVFQILFSETVKQNVTTDQNLNTDLKYIKD